MSKANLEKYYPGDSDWEEYAVSFEPYWNECNFKKDLLKAVNGDRFIAISIYGNFFDTSIEWLNLSIPALDNLTPKECLKSKKGLLRLKTALLRMP